MSLIQIRDLVKTFNGQTVLGGIDLDVAAGEVKVIMGASGCGKTTLLRCLNRLVEPTSGSIHVDGVDVGNPQTDIRKLRQRIGFVFQQFALYRHLSVMDNVTLGLIKLRGMSNNDAADAALKQLDRLEMGRHHDKYPSELSGGQKQRVALARVLAMDPSVVVLDEPTSALDPVMSQEVGALIRQLNAEGVTIICATHDVGLGRSIADRVVFLENGVVKANERFDYLAQTCPDAETRAFFDR